MHPHSYLGAIVLLTSVTTIVSALPEKEILVPILPRQSSEEDYLTSVCSPNITSGTIPPCIEVITIQSACTPNGTTPLDYLAHAQCMCNGGFFSNWLGCLNCDYVHGGRSPAVVSAFNTIITSASNQLCTGTPTASFAAIFNSLGGGDVAEGTATQLTDLYPSETAVSLYYTASGNQGPGAITGSATGATKTGGTSASVAATGSSSASGVSATATKTTAGSAGTTASGTETATGSTSRSTGGAAPTGVMRGFLGMAIGGVVMAAL
ncbi:uncharacterized protein EAF02_003368 [Botrytis sinoallii]|uniref:uncharacterized protein n=1 Tax=Botrytis sinoallii TaxID=1463999 RepID=UPI0018FFB13F|nr:uncharacterized protein EAF02_003368 [Botrytis sinoallii]KAF7886721.1 hypothetical protein EAF02_003368 [Botrytis sinoallii]